ncbi:MAG: OmpA family protein [Bacteroidota bacterium]
MLSGLSFDHDQATLTAASKSAIEEIARLLRDQPDLQAFIVGHTDLSGELGYNLELSERRAAYVVKVLTLEHGIDPDRLEAHGVGPLSPIIH